MSLPIRTTIEDIDAVCGYLITKPTGATLAEAKAVIDKKRLDARKLAALRFWGFIDEDSDKLKITNRGREAIRNSGSSRSQVLLEIVRGVAAYTAVVERIVFRREGEISATDVAAHWYEHFRADVSGLEKTLHDQAVCFFHIAQGADLGTLIVGRKGMETRFDFDMDNARSFTHMTSPTGESHPTDDLQQEADESEAVNPPEEPTVTSDNTPSNNRIFITHGRNKKILGQVKELVTYGKFEPVVAMEHETPARPVPQKVMSDMRTCRAAVIHVDAETMLYDGDGTEVPRINGNVLIEIGAAMALYDDKFVLLVEEGIELPSNLQGLYECRYEGDELNMTAVMKLLKAFNEF